MELDKWGDNYPPDMNYRRAVELGIEDEDCTSKIEYLEVN
jgi:hypothetical protein